jgi:flagellar L-ring protein FlgH
MKKFMWFAVSLSVIVTGTFAAPLSGQGRPPRANWLADGSKLGVGDVVTVLVDEYVLASADVARVDARQKDSNQGLDAAGSGFGVRTVNDATDRRRGENTRRDAFTAEMTARVVEVSADGRLLRVEGKKTTKIDDHEQTLTISGWVRATDVSASNTIPSARLADAEVLYSSNGVLGQPTQGIVAKILGIIF